MQLTPLVAIHMSAALAATAIGPIALWARRGRAQRPRLHRAFGYAWVTLMTITATSAIFIKGTRIPGIGGFGPVHILIPVVFGFLILAFWFLAKGNINGHRKSMQGLFVGTCIAGIFTLVPGRYLHGALLGALGIA